MSNNIKIGLVGKMRSGKDTVGHYLLTQYGCQPFAFGDGIKEVIKKYFPEEYAVGKPRKHLQHLGQSFRELNENVWIDYMFNSIRDFVKYKKNFLGEEANIVVTDVRQLNEVTRLSDEGYIIIKVICPDEIRRRRIANLGDIMTEEQLNHDTEKQVDLIIPDYEVVNDGTIDDLYKKVNEIVGGEYFENQQLFS